MNFVGLDLSLTDSGIVALTNCSGDKYADIEMEHITTKPKDWEFSIGRVEHISDEVIKHIKRFNPELIVVEDYFTGRNAKAVISLCELGTLVRYKLLLNGFKFITVAPNQLKKYCLGQGNAGKELILKGVYKKWNLDINNNNIADATVLAFMSKAIYNESQGVSQNLLKYEMDVVKKVLSSRLIVDGLR